MYLLLYLIWIKLKLTRWTSLEGLKQGLQCTQSQKMFFTNWNLLIVVITSMNKFCHSIIPSCFIIPNFQTFCSYYWVLGLSYVVTSLKEINFAGAIRTSLKPELELCLIPANRGGRMAGSHAVFHCVNHYFKIILKYFVLDGFASCTEPQLGWYRKKMSSTYLYQLVRVIMI